jgi:hypothetical protein
MTDTAVRIREAPLCGPLVPNPETIEAMKAARRGDLVTVGSPDALLASLNAGEDQRDKT